MRMLLATNSSIPRRGSAAPPTSWALTVLRSRWSLLTTALMPLCILQSITSIKTRLRNT